jgi:histidinol phosphatase-like PHP family hydrolase
MPHDSGGAVAPLRICAVLPNILNEEPQMKLNYDIHIHTNLSSCAVSDATVEKYIDGAAKDGLQAIGFSNHLWDSTVSGASPWYRPQNVEHVLQLKQELSNDLDRKGLRILFGCETEFTHEGKLCLAEENMDLFDYILVPHSHTHMRVVMPQEYAEDHKVHAKYLMDSFMQVVTHPLSKRFTAVAHPFVPGTRFSLYNTVQSLIPDSYLMEAFDAAKENGVAIELNGSCLIFMPEEVILIEYSNTKKRILLLISPLRKSGENKKKIS